MADSDKSFTLKQRTITHMNYDHQDSISSFLEYYCKVPPHLASNAQIDDMKLSYLIIRSRAGRNVVPIDPPMESWDQARARIIEMHHTAYKGLGRSDIKVSEYRPPKTLKQVSTFMALLASYFVASSRRNFEDGSLLHGMLLKWAPPLERLCYIVAPYYLALIMTVHVGETVWLAIRMKRYGVTMGSGLWWKWVVTCMIDGMFCLERFDELIKEKEEVKGSHKPTMKSDSP